MEGRTRSSLTAFHSSSVNFFVSSFWGSSSSFLSATATTLGSAGLDSVPDIVERVQLHQRQGVVVEVGVESRVARTQ